MVEQLANAVRNGQIILFVGAGVSTPLGLPSWNALIQKMGQDLGYDTDIFASLGNNLELVGFYRINKRSIGQLRSWMDREWHNPGIDIKRSCVHELIVKMNFPLIYTTNYDRWLEYAFEYHQKPYIKIANASDIKNFDANATQIVKLHGDFDDDNSIVIAESDYFDRLDFESPLDIKFRSDALGKSILFIGYSLSDINIRLLLYKLWKMWKETERDGDRPPSYVFLTRPNAVRERILRNWGITALTEDVDDPAVGLQQFLGRLQKQVSGVED